MMRYSFTLAALLLAALCATAYSGRVLLAGESTTVAEAATTVDAATKVDAK
jgi:hypothetical protein